MKRTLKKLGRLCYTFMCTLVISCSDSANEQPTSPTPEPEPTTKDYQLEDNVILLKENTMNHINSVEGMTIIYNGNTAKENLPQTGEIILVSKPNKIFPHGFLGKVTKINEQGGQYHIETESVAIDEAFSYLNVSQSFELTPQKATPIARSTESDTDFITFSRPIHKEIAEGIDINGELILGIKVDVTFNIDKRNGKNIRNGNITTSILQQVDMSLDIELEKEYEGSANLTPKAITLPSFQLGPITLVPAIQPYLFIEANGKIETHPSMNYQQIRKSSLAFDGHSWNFNNENSSEPGIRFNLTPDIHMEGSLYDGIGVVMEFRLYGNENNKAFIDAKLGPQISGDVTLSTNPDSLYESGKDSYLDFCMQFTAGGGAGVKFLSIEKEWSNYPVNLSFLKSTRHFFPSFENDKVKKGERQATASTTLGRDLLWETEVGLALYDGDKCVQKSDSVKYQFEKGFEEKNPLQATFEELPKENNYSVWSYIKWGDMTVRCKQLNRKILSAKYSSGNYSSSYDFTYGNNGLIERIKNIETEAGSSATRYYNFEYSNGNKQVNVNITEGYTEESYQLRFTLNNNGYIESCRQTFYDGEVDIWEYEYNKDNQMTKMKRTESYETWYLTYDNGNAIGTTCTKEGYSHISYNTAIYNGNAVLHETLYGIDIDEMEIYGLLGMLGKPSKNLPIHKDITLVHSDESDSHFTWTTDNQGYPSNLTIREGGWTNRWSFIWE